MSSITARCTAALVGAALVVVPVLPAQAATPEQEAADWMVSQLVDGLAPGQSGSGDVGLTADVVIALDALGDDRRVTNVVAAMEPATTDYVTLFGDEGSVFPGAAGKVASAVRLAAQDPTSYDGLNLDALVERSVRVPGQPVGAAYDIYSADATDSVAVNSIAQSWAARTLLEADSELADDAVGYLLRQQCPSGSVRLLMAHDPCGAETRISHDTTALVLDVLVRARDAGLTPAPQDVTTPTLDQAIERAASALQSAQAGDGSLQDDGTANTNTTGLAAAALAAASREDAAASAARWVASLRVDSGDDLGAIAYDVEAFDAAGAGGISGELRDQWLRATAQASLALPLADVVPALSVDTGAGRFAAPGAEVTVRVKGLAPGEAFTVTGGQQAASGTAADGTARTTVTLPDEAGEVTLTLTGADETRTASATVEVLPPTEFTVTAPERVPPGAHVDVQVDGARDREPLRTQVLPADAPEPADEGSTVALAVNETVRAPSEPGEYVVVVTSAVPDRQGASDVVTVAVAADDGGSDDDGGIADPGAGGDDLVPIGSAELPDAGADFGVAWLGAALAALLAGGVTLVLGRARQGAHR